MLGKVLHLKLTQQVRRMCGSFSELRVALHFYLLARIFRLVVHNKLLLMLLVFPDFLIKKVNMAPGWNKPFLSDRQNSSMIPTYPLIYTEKLESLSQASYINHML